MKRLISCFFPGAPEPNTWPRLSRVLAYTAAMRCPEWVLRIESLQAPKNRRDIGVPSHVDNTHKLAWWADRVREASDGDEILLIDADTAILKPLDEIWDQPFDVAYTVRTGFFAPFNAGVIFLRVSQQSRWFMDRWVTWNDDLLHGNAKPWRKSYGGVNQAALAKLLNEADGMGVHVKPLSCRVWNCEDSAWAHFDHSLTKILHVKSGLRRACLQRLPMVNPEYVPLVALWRQLEAEAMKEAKSA